MTAMHHRLTDRASDGVIDDSPKAPTGAAVAYLFGGGLGPHQLRLVDECMSASIALAASGQGAIDLENALRRYWSDIDEVLDRGVRISDLVGDTSGLVGFL